MKKLIVCLAAIFLLCGCSAGSGSGSTAVTTTLPILETVELTLLAFSPPPEGVVELVNERLAAIGLPARLTVETLNTKGFENYLASYQNLLPKADMALFLEAAIFRKFATEGALAELSPVLEAAPGLLAALPEDAWTAASEGGGVYAVPLSDDGGVSLRQSGVLLRADVLQALGAEDPTSPQELLELCKLAKEQGQPSDLAYMIAPPYAFHRTYAEWPFFVDNLNLVCFAGDGTVGSYAESPVYELDAELMSGFAKAGVLRSLYTEEDLKKFEQNWDGLAALYPVGFPADAEFAGNLKLIQFKPEAGNIRITPRYTRFIAVSAASENAVAAVQLLEALYTVQDAYDAFIYGVEGTDWTREADGRRTVLRHNDFGQYFRSAGALQRELSAASASILTTLAPPETLLPFTAGEYSYQTDLKLMEKIIMSPAYSGGVLGMREGYAPLANRAGVINNLNNAGLQELVEQYRTQYEEFSKK